MRTIASALGIFVGLLIVGVCFLLGFYKNDPYVFSSKKNYLDSNDIGYGN